MFRTAETEKIRLFTSKPGKGDVLVRLGENAHLSEDVVEVMCTDPSYPESDDDEEDEPPWEFGSIGRMPDTYHGPAPQEFSFASMDYDDESDSDDEKYDAPSWVDEERRKHNPAGYAEGLAEFYWKKPKPGPSKKNVYHPGLKQVLKQELWHLAHHYHDGLDGHYLNLPHSKEAFNAGVLFTDDE